VYFYSQGLDCKGDANIKNGLFMGVSVKRQVICVR